MNLYKNLYLVKLGVGIFVENFLKWEYISFQKYCKQNILMENNFQTFKTDNELWMKFLSSVKFMIFITLPDI